MRARLRPIGPPSKEEAQASLEGSFVSTGTGKAEAFRLNPMARISSNPLHEIRVISNAVGERELSI